ncbi:MAG TPA: crossover junction endodeoxyribonuclease RuvC [Planctomycetaceae bacterium]|jgi:crossover junction endodeoxyribonuclease RuvC|nr:crossover junction endodeoxyribonuclease RuvC [Planctomycetaceae bacterium]
MTVTNRFLGIDPGLGRTGYALIERTARGPVLREGGVIQTKTDQSLHLRLGEIAREIREILAELKPSAVGIEQVFSHARNVRSSLMLAHARGAILATVAENAVPLLQYSPAQIKQMLTGSGKAGKEQMQHAVRAELRLATIPEPHDVADAAAVALCLFHSLRFAA